MTAAEFLKSALKPEYIGVMLASLALLFSVCLTCVSMYRLYLSLSSKEGLDKEP